MRPDIIHIAWTGEALLDFMEKIGTAQVELLMNREQYNFIHQNMRFVEGRGYQRLTNDPGDGMVEVGQDDDQGNASL